ncbi:MAG: hypothetical protein NT018_03030 [Armatimonadetes bacterium]|nr:hypothetical protein [Armatimonadota bacterium]
MYQTFILLCNAVIGIACVVAVVLVLSRSTIFIVSRMLHKYGGASTQSVPNILIRISGGVGSICGVLAGWLLFSQLYDAAGDLGRIVVAFVHSIIFGAPLGALLGICVAIFVRQFVRCPAAEARIGAAFGIMVALVAGYPLLLFIPEFVYNDVSGARVAAMALIYIVFLLAGWGAGYAYSKLLSRASKILCVAVAVVFLAGLVVTSISSRRAISVHTSSLTELYDKNDTQGLLDKVRNPRLSLLAVGYYVMLAPEKALSSENPSIKHLAAIELADRKDPKALPVLLEYLHQGDKEATRHLSKYRDMRSVNALVSVIERSANPRTTQRAPDDLVQAAVYSLGWMGDKSAAPAIEALLLRRLKNGMRGGGIELEALDAIARLDQKRAVPLFIGILHDQRWHSDTRKKAALLLSKMKDPEGRRLAAQYQQQYR